MLPAPFGAFLRLGADSSARLRSPGDGGHGQLGTAWEGAEGNEALQGCDRSTDTACHGSHTPHPPLTLVPKRCRSCHTWRTRTWLGAPTPPPSRLAGRQPALLGRADQGFCGRAGSGAAGKGHGNRGGIADSRAHSDRQRLSPAPAAPLCLPPAQHPGRFPRGPWVAAPRTQGGQASPTPRLAGREGRRAAGTGRSAQHGPPERRSGLVSEPRWFRSHWLKIKPRRRS